MISDDFEIESSKHIRYVGGDRGFTVLELHLFIEWQADIESWREHKSLHNARRLFTSWWAVKTNRGAKLRRLVRYGRVR